MEELTSWYAIEVAHRQGAEHGMKRGQIVYLQDEADARIRELEEENAELNNLFDLQQKRMDEATEAWQEATGRHDVLPDLGSLLGWLMDRARLDVDAPAETPEPDWDELAEAWEGADDATLQAFRWLRDRIKELENTLDEVQAELIALRGIGA